MKIFDWPVPVQVSVMFSLWAALSSKLKVRTSAGSDFKEPVARRVKKKWTPEVMLSLQPFRLKYQISLSPHSNTPHDVSRAQLFWRLAFSERVINALVCDSSSIMKLVGFKCLFHPNQSDKLHSKATGLKCRLSVLVNLINSVYSAILVEFSLPR